MGLSEMGPRENFSWRARYPAAQFIYGAPTSPPDKTAAGAQIAAAWGLARFWGLGWDFCGRENIIKPPSREWGPKGHAAAPFFLVKLLGYLLFIYTPEKCILVPNIKLIKLIIESLNSNEIKVGLLSRRGKWG
jgi:hypothetical protein